MAQSASEGTLLARLFIIVVALGIIVLGIYPIRSDIREVALRTKRYVNKNLPILTDSAKTASRAERSAAEKRSADTDELGADGLPKPRKPAGIVVEKGSAGNQKLDKLTTDDRKELSDLVNSF